MNVFNKRPLALILCVILGGFSLFVGFSPILKTIMLCLAVVLIFLAFIFKNRTATSFKIASICLLVSFLCSFLYFEYLFYPIELYEKELTIEAKVIDYEKENDYLKTIDIETISIDNKDSEYKIRLNLYGYNDDIEVGSIIKFTTKLEELESSSDFNFRQYYTSRGFCATATLSEFEILRQESVPLSYRFEQIRDNIYEKARNLSNEDAAAMLSALLLGEREKLSGQIKLDFLRIGITHILSLSGIHLSILTMGVDKLLYFCRVGKKIRIATGCLFSVFFMALTGFPLSVCRAGIMLIISSLVYLLSGCKDSMTSLFIAGTVIITVKPYAALDVGLWLSILATAGIMIANEFMNEKYSEETGIKKILRGILISFIFSLFAVCATSIITAISFDGTSTISILSTFIFSILVEIFVYLGIVVLAIGSFIPIGKALIGMESVIAALAEFLSDLPFVYASVEFLITKIAFIGLGILLATFAIFKIKRRKIFISCIMAMFICSSILSVGLTEASRANDALISASNGSDRIIIKSDNKTALLDISSHSISEAFYNNSLLVEEKITELDYYIPINYSDTLPESINVLLYNNMVYEVLLPSPKSIAEEEIAIECFKTINEYRTSVFFYEDNEIVSIGDYEMLIPHRHWGANALSVTLKKSDEIFTYLSSGVLEYISYSEELLYVSDYLIFGNFGEAYSSPKIIDEFGKKLKKVIVYDEKINFDFTYAIWDVPKMYYVRDKMVIDD